MNLFIKIAVTDIQYEDRGCGRAPRNLILDVDREWYKQSPRASVEDAIIDYSGYEVVDFNFSPTSEILLTNIKTLI